MPARGNFDHSVTVSLVYHGKADVALPFSGKAGADIVSISSTASPTKAPTKAPVVAVEQAAVEATQAPYTGPSGCSNVVDLNGYYRACTSSSERPSQFFSAPHAA